MLSSKVCESTASHANRHSMGFGAAPQPEGTMEYVTSSRDTLQSIAVSFDTTTSSLMKLNRMSSLTIFPGQTLYVPATSGDGHSPSPPPVCEEINVPSPKSGSWENSFTGEFSFLSPLSPSSSTMRTFKDLVMVSSKPEPTPDRNSNIEDYLKTFSIESNNQAMNKQARGVGENDTRDLMSDTADRHRIMSDESTESEPFEEGFLKMTVQYITGQKEMITGVMLVTPTALMFDPEADDPVVVRDGCDEYGIMCPMQIINSVAMYNDTSRMTPVCQLSPTEAPADGEIARTEGCEADDQDSIHSSTTCDNTQKESNSSTAETGNGSCSEGMYSDHNTESKSTMRNGNDSNIPNKATHGQASNQLNKSRRVPGNAVPAAVLTNTSDAVRNEGTYQLTPTEFPALAPRESADEEEKAEFSKLETEFPFLHSLVKTVGDLIPTALDTHEKAGVGKRKLQPQKPNSNHMFLCIRARRPMVKTYSVTEADDFIMTLADDMHKEVARFPEYWFQVPRKRSDHVYAFFLQWTPGNTIDDMAEELGFVDLANEALSDDMDDNNENAKRIRNRTLTNSSLEFVEDFFDESYSFEKEWEIISIQEAKRRSIVTNAIELAEADDSLIPELEKPSNIFTESTLLSLCRNLPNRCVGYSWYPVYTTYDHGTSLRTLYRNLFNVDAPVVLVIQDDKDHIFGVLCSNSLHVSDHYYGTGESFLFTLAPEFEVFKWTGNNSFFIKGDIDSITFGGGKGTFGLWLDSDLYRGCSHPCETFNNKVLSCDEDFIIHRLEVWLIKDM